jgi:hypothetical protein
MDMYNNVYLTSTNFNLPSNVNLKQFQYVQPDTNLSGCYYHYLGGDDDYISCVNAVSLKPSNINSNTTFYVSFNAKDYMNLLIEELVFNDEYVNFVEKTFDMPMTLVDLLNAILIPLDQGFDLSSLHTSYFNSNYMGSVLNYSSKDEYSATVELEVAVCFNYQLHVPPTQTKIPKPSQSILVQEPPQDVYQIVDVDETMANAILIVLIVICSLLVLSMFYSCIFIRRRSLDKVMEDFSKAIN